MKLLISIIAIIIIAIAAAFFLNKPGIGIVGDVHRHADFKVYLNDQPINFTQEKYMSFANHTLSNFIHLHDMDGDVIHLHASGVKLKAFFSSLGMNFTKTCFTIDSESTSTNDANASKQQDVLQKKDYCNDQANSLKFFVNGRQNSEFQDYEIQDLDKILISYGPKNQDINFQIISITNKSCIQSGKCPERGAPSNESSCTSAGCEA